jgi:hypothetical protein
MYKQATHRCTVHRKEENDSIKTKTKLLARFGIGCKEKGLSGNFVISGGKKVL